GIRCWVSRWDAGLLSGGREDQVSFQAAARPPQSSRSNHLCCQLSLVVTDALSNQQSIFVEASAKLPGHISILRVMHALRIRMRGENRRRTPARAFQHRYCVRARVRDRLEIGLDPRIPKPSNDSLGDRKLMPCDVGQIPDRERQVHERLAILFDA